MWVSYIDKGFQIIDHKKNITTTIKSNNSNLYIDDINTFHFEHSQDVWIGHHCLERGYFDEKRNKYITKKIFIPDELSDTKLPSWYIPSIYKSKKGDLWIGNSTALSKIIFPKNSEDSITFKSYKIDSDQNIAGKMVWAIQEDKDGNIWIGTNFGLSKLDPITETIENFYHQLNDSTSLSIDNTKFIHIDDHNRLWVATEGGGLNMLKKDGKSFKRYTKENGLPSNEILCITHDTQGKIWMSTTNEICSLNPKNDHIISYDETDGLQDRQFRIGSFFKDRITGEIYFGGKKGITVFDPLKVRQRTFVPNIYLTSLKINGKELKQHSITQDSAKNALFSNVLTLEHTQNNLIIDFAALDFAAPDNIKYAYTLEGFEKDWTHRNAHQSEAKYTNLGPGTYQFKIKATNADGVWSDHIKTIEINILPPWWKTTWFKIFLVLLAIGTLYLWVKLREVYLKRLNSLLTEKVTIRTAELTKAHDKLKKQQEEISQKNIILEQNNAEQLQKNEEIKAMAEQVQQAHQAKIQFFTNISHEFRTPLTLILAPVHKLLEAQAPVEWSKTQTILQRIEKNADNLLWMVDEILKLRKVEFEAWNFTPTLENIESFAKKVFQSFTPLMEKKNIDYTFFDSLTIQNIQFDTKIVETILNNLLSNAFKHTPEEGSISFTIENSENEVSIIVNNSGKGIDKALQQKIFDRFYQVEENDTGSSGIGLSLVKKLSELHNGKVYVESEQEKGASFVFKFPIEEYQQEEIIELTPAPVFISSEEEKHIKTDKEQKGIANRAIRTCLYPKYKIEICRRSIKTRKQRF